MKRLASSTLFFSWSHSRAKKLDFGQPCFNIVISRTQRQAPSFGGSFRKNIEGRRVVAESKASTSATGTAGSFHEKGRMPGGLPGERLRRPF